MTLEEFLAQWNSPSPTMKVHTSGSTGKPKTIEVEKERMRASARMTCDFLGLHPGDTVLLCLPLDYIAGKMMVVRALERGLNLLSVEPDGHPLARYTLHGYEKKSLDLVAMVPLQIWNTLHVPEERETLLSVRNLIIGGGAISRELELELRTLPINVWSSYGMTETLSHIALRRISEEYYTPLPGINVEQAEDGCLIIDAPMLCREKLFTNDIANITTSHKFKIIGRKDNTICSGGIKIQIEEVEAWLQSIGFNDVMVTFREDSALGQAVVYLVTSDIDTERLKRTATSNNSQAKFWMPRHVIKVSSLPLTPTGKPNRAEAHKIAQAGKDFQKQALGVPK